MKTLAKSDAFHFPASPAAALPRAVLAGRATGPLQDRGHKQIVLCPPPTEKTFRNDRTAALFTEILTRARPKPNDLSNILVALLCVVIILAPFAALLLYNANLQAGW